MLSGAIYDAVRRRTELAFGRSVNLHLFRDAAATFWCVEAPEAVLGTRDLLGHQHVSTTDAYYRHSQTMHAAEVYSRVLEERVRRSS
jgi:integrase